MAVPTKQASRWGSFLQQALDGVESRLDNILVGDGPLDTSTNATTATTTASTKIDNGSVRNMTNTSTTSDRLQERLARAVAAKKSVVSKAESRASSSNVPSRVGSPVTTAGTPRQSMDDSSLKSDDATIGDKRHTSFENNSQTTKTGLEAADILSEKAWSPMDGLTLRLGIEQSPNPSTESNESSVHWQSVDSPLQAIGTVATVQREEVTSDCVALGNPLDPNKEDRDLVKQQQNNTKTSDLERQEEIHGYIERIDALQAKLQYLARESTESARKAASISVTNAEKKLAEKDEQIALLMEEGQKLSKTELKHMTIIKKLRSKTAEAEKETADAKKKLEKTEKEKASLLERLKRTEVAEKLSLERQKALTQLHRENEVLAAERDGKDSTIAELKAQLLDSTKQANADEVNTIQWSLMLEKHRAAELENDISTLKVEKELAAGRAKAQLEELKAKFEREAERNRVTEVEMRAEQQMLESRLEVMRTRAEEVSSGSTGDAQAKFLRQIETLQTQYAIACENWQGIESSLTARATSLEGERNEAVRRETDIRRKAREVTSKAKQNEEELEETRTRLAALEAHLNEQMQQAEILQSRISECESARLEDRKIFEQEKQAWKAEVNSHMDEERTKWREDTGSYSLLGIGEVDFPALSQRNLTADLLGLQNLQSRNPARSFAGEFPAAETRTSRKPSSHRLQSSGQATPHRQDLEHSFTNEEEFEQPLVHAADYDGYFEHILSPSPSNQTIQDVVSVSTVGAGPSVQLVERMSAAVRRLESEKVSTKEEVRRLSAQRDEARAQIVMLMRDLEAKRGLDTKIRDLEEENNKINSRYQTTLEMLGEKSELVEELRADVQDVKDMYRELVERTIK